MTDNALRDIALTDIALTDIALTDKALIDQALTDKALIHQALTGKAWNFNAALPVGACPTGTQAWLKNMSTRFRDCQSREACHEESHSEGGGGEGGRGGVGRGVGVGGKQEYFQFWEFEGAQVQADETDRVKGVKD